MANKTIPTQILLRNDTLANWEASTRVLGKGEPAVVYAPDTETAGYKVKVKYGDGVHTFAQLPYGGIDLSDIPLASASVDGLLSKADFEKLAGVAAGAQVNIIESVKVNGSALEITDKGVNIVVPTGTLASKNKIAESDLDDALAEKVNAASDGNHSHLNKTVLDGITSEKVTAWDAAQANVIETVKVNGTALTPDAAKAVNVTVPTGALASKDKVAEADLETELATKINGKADSADLTTLSGRVTTAEGKLTTLNGDATVAGSVAQQVAAAVAQIVSDAPEAYDTLKEISDWIATHADSASAMHTAINNLKALVGTLPEGAVSTTVVAYIKEYCDAAVAGLKIGDYAKAADLTAAVTRITALETAVEGKVDKVEGSRLITDAEGTKLSGIAAGATKVEASTTNGNVKINGTETTVYTLPTEVLMSTDTLILNGGNA